MKNSITAKKIVSAVLAGALCAAALPSFASCSKTPTLRIASWEEYIDEGDETNNPMVEDFEVWYEQQTGNKIKVEYVPLDDNETMYNKISLGEKYDLLCPSEYMIMKLQAEGKLEKFSESFFDTSVDTNYYAKNVSPYIDKTFTEGKFTNGESWRDYAAGYMWGTTGFVVKHELDEEAQSWNIVKNHGAKATAKNNVRDSYFMGLGMYYENQIAEGSLTKEAFTAAIADKMNDTSAGAMDAVKTLLTQVKTSGVRFETDDAKEAVIAGEYDVSYQWSGDAVYILDLAEEENEITLDYVIPSLASNLWFDGWVMMKGANVDAAAAFINFVSMPENAVRNCDYIGYTPCVGGKAVFDYFAETYSAADGAVESMVDYDLSYFFAADGNHNENYVLSVPESQLRRQLFAQFPDEETIKRLVVMRYFDAATNERANSMWNDVSAAN